MNDVMIKVVFCLHRSTLSEIPNSKASLASPRISRSTSKGVAKSDADSASALQSGRLSVDRSPRSVTSKPTTERRPPKLGVGGGNTPDKKTSRLSKPAELQSELSLAQEDLKKAKETLGLLEKEKEKFLDELKEAHKLADEANEKLREAVLAQKRAEENSEIENLKSLLDSKNKTEDKENDKFMTELSLEVDSLRQELKKAKIFEEKLKEKDAALEHLTVDLEATKMAESYAHNLVDELHYRVDELSAQAEQAKRLERSASESLKSVVKQLEVSNDSLHDSQSEISLLKEKVGLLEISIRRQKVDLEESERRLELVNEEASVMAKKVESIQFELESVKEEKIQALSNEKLAADSVQTLLEEKNKLINDLENSRDEEEKTKKALESLASALHEVSAEARDAKEKLLTVEGERENYETQIEHLELALKATNDRCERMLSDAKQEIGILKNAIEESKSDHRKLTADLEQKELHLMNSVKKSVEDNSSMEGEINRLVNLLKMAEEEACAVKEEEERWKDIFKEAESEIISLKDVLAQTKDESMRLKEILMDRENEIQSILQENQELQNKEAALLIKAEELSKLLEEALAKKQILENDELTDSEKDYDMLPKVVEFFEQNGTGNVKKQNNNSNDEASVTETLNGKHMENDMSEEVDIKMWDSCKIDEKDLSPEGETEHEAFEDDRDSKADGYDHVNGLSSLTESLDNGGSSPSKQQNQKKKKPLLQKFGGLLKKKSPSSHNERKNQNESSPPFFDEEDSLLDLETSNANALFAVAKRLEKLYRGSKVYVGLQIPDPDSASRRNIDLVLVTDQEAVVISVKNVGGFVSVEKDGNWVCTSGKHHKTELVPNPVVESKQLVSILEEYLEQRGVALPEEYLCFKVICANPNFRAIRSGSFPPEVITYDQWMQLKPEQKNAGSGWLKGAFLGGKKKNQESFSEKINSVLSTSPVLDRLELKGNKYVLGEFLEFKGKREDIHALREIKRSKISNLTVQKISMFGFAKTTLQLLYAPRDYHSEGPSWSSQWKELTVSSSIEVVFQPHNSTKVRKYKLSKVVSMSLSA
ncbi:hypothetical protein F511_14061 [Dorcoceras hygrometricum]|uniref:NERD domain-containing protein n=1 Tax=Dorcoceras hygrometricum TaxID=472368 RepID=A0A2Z7C2D9_9LAMI|nr:hypothetical protein F511_14061 [Dorcoceras hygrometricum]